MSPQPYGTTTPEQRDQVAEDHDEAAAERDRASAARDGKADERDQRAAARMQAGMQYAGFTRRLLDTAARQPGADQRLIRAALSHLSESLEDAELDRQAAIHDRRAAAADRSQAACDRLASSGHRGQTAIERAQHAMEPAGHEHWLALYARAQSARDGAGTAGGPAPAPGPAALPGDLPGRSELARLQACLDTMPVTEQAKGIMAESGCGDAEAFDHLRQTSQRRNAPVRDLPAG